MSGVEVLVVGGNAAGMTAASRAKRLDPGLRVTVLEAGPRIAYSICGLPYYVGGRVAQLEELELFTPERLKNERGIDARIQTRAVELLPAARRVVVEDARTGSRSSLSFDRLLLATGYRPRRPAFSGFDLAGVHTVARLDDGAAVRSCIDGGEAGRAVLIGAGYVALEMAEALVGRGVRVTLVERERQVFPALDAEIAALVEAELARHGVEVLTGREVAGLSGTSGGRVEAVELARGGLRLPAGLVLVDIGVEPNVDLARDAGLALGPSGGIEVSDRMETSAFGVYAAGNCVETVNLASGRPEVLPLGTVAAKQGRVAGENLAGRRTRFRGAVGTSIVKVFDVVAARTGLTEGQARAAGFAPLAATIEGKFRAAYFGGAPATVKVVADAASGRLLGAQIVGSAEGAASIDVAATAITAGMDVSEASGLDLAYAPPAGALWHPLLIALNQLSRSLG